MIGVAIAAAEAPRLSMTDLRDELALIHRKKHRTTTTALYATGDPGLTSVKLDAETLEFEVRPVQCELDFRRALSEPSRDRPLALLVDYRADRLPADLQGRIAGGKVYPVDRSRRVARLFGASAVSGEVLSCRPLCDALLSDPRPLGHGVAGSTVDLATAWRALLARDAGAPLEGDLSEPRLVAHCASSRPPPDLAKKLGGSTAVGQALLDHLRDHVGPIAVITWRAWEVGKARTVAALAFVLDAGREKVRTDAGLRSSVALVLKGLGLGLALDPALAPRWAALAEPLHLRLSTEAGRAVLAEADELIADPEAREALSGSRYLRVAFDAAARRLGRVLLEAAREPTLPAARLDEARGELDHLSRHELHRTHEAGELVMRARMATRLLAYLLERPGVDPDRAAALRGSYGHVFALSEHYVSHGSWVDLARARARGPVASDLERAIEAMVERVDALRDRDDEAFARAYVSWMNSGSPSNTAVVPIAEGLTTIAAAFVKNTTHRRLLVAVLDGMAWANAVELLQDCEDKAFAPLRFGDEGRPRPMLAALPSLTGVSRAALLGGKAPKAGESLDTSKDPERFATHPGLRRAGIEDAVLYLKDSVETSSGDLHPRAIDLVRSDAQVVGLVINAIDDQLGGARQVRVPVDIAHIKPLGRLLAEATQANRAVLLIADHGHVRTDRMKSVGRPGDGKRYRYLGADDRVEDDEVVVSREVAWAPRGKAKVAMLFRDRDSYGSTHVTGEHGGASLAEVVAPAILIGSDQLRRRVEVAEGRDDPELEVTPLRRPGFWDLTPPKEAPVTKGPRAKSAPPPPAAKKNQPLLPIFEAPKPAPAAEVVPESPWIARLTSSKAFEGRSPKERKRLAEVIAPRVAILADAGGSMPADRFAREVMVLPHAVGGVVSEMAEWINFDAYLVVEHEPRTGRVTLNVALLDEYLREAG